MQTAADPVAVSQPAVGLLLCNLGSPSAPTPAAARRYLHEFLADRRVIEMPRLPWWLLRNLVVIPLRHRRTARLYQRIWTADGAPLVATTLCQAAGLQRLLQERLGCRLPVQAAMRYGEPSIAAGLQRLREIGCRRLLVLPLYPQYSATTTASVLDRVNEVLATWRWLPELRTITGYAEHPGYLAALAASVEDHRRQWGPEDRLLLSFHGIPEPYATAGDPYPQQCHATATAVADRLGLTTDAWAIAFQSRFGRARWIGPATDELLRRWGTAGLGRVAVLCPGFAADCLETLEEIELGGRELLTAAGGGMLHYIPALNDRPDHLAALANLAEQHLGGWL